MLFAACNVTLDEKINAIFWLSKRTYGMRQNRLRSLGRWEISRRNACLNIIKIGLLLVQTALFMVVWFRFYQRNMLHPYYYWGNWVIGAVFMILFLLFARLYGGFHINTARASEIAYSL